jgi:hypothetical protein
MAVNPRNWLAGVAMLGLVSGGAPALAQQDTTGSQAPAANTPTDSSAQAQSGSSVNQGARHRGAAMRHANRSSMRKSAGSRDDRISARLNREELERLQGPSR